MERTNENCFSHKCWVCIVTLINSERVSEWVSEWVSECVRIFSLPKAFLLHLIIPKSYKSLTKSQNGNFLRISIIMKRLVNIITMLLHAKKERRKVKFSLEHLSMLMHAHVTVTKNARFPYKTYTISWLKKTNHHHNINALWKLMHLTTWYNRTSIVHNRVSCPQVHVALNHCSDNRVATSLFCILAHFPSIGFEHFMCHGPLMTSL